MYDIIGFDTETDRITENNLDPDIVCLTVCPFSGEHMDLDYAEMALATEQNKAHLEDCIGEIYNPENGFLKVAHNTAFDLAVLAKYNPEWECMIWHGLAQNQFTDTMIRQKLLNIAAFGRHTEFRTPDGRSLSADYSLAGLVKFHFGIDISADKDDSDSYRTFYNELRDVPVRDWPADAVTYALDDAKWPVLIYLAQEAHRKELIEKKGIDPLKQEFHRTALAYALYKMSMRGMKPNKGALEALIEETLTKLTPEALPLLFENKILSPATPPRPYANGASNEDGTPKMTAGTKEKLNKKTLQEYVLKIAKTNENIKVKYNPPTAKMKEKGIEQGNMKLDAEWMEDNASFDPVLEQYQTRAKLQKLVTTEIPRLYREDGELADTVHFGYNVVLNTGRTSSFASKIYPSANGQNIDRRVRNCYEARPGYVLLSTDLNQMELGTLAQRCFSLFGFSVHRDRINQQTGDLMDSDCHSFLGAQLAFHLDPAFGEICKGEGVDTKEEIFRVFKAMARSGDEGAAKMYKHYRTFAKPTGLGYPGGLGPATFILFAKGTYKVSVDLDTATRLREIWHDTYPEMKLYFEYINTELIDPFNERYDEENDKTQKRYHYTTPLGLYCCDCAYTSASNALGLQAISADGATLGVVDLVRKCYDPLQDSILYGNAFPVNFIHDENLLEVRDDPAILEEVAQEVEDTMCSAMRQITPDVIVRAESAYMRIWDKRAERVEDDNGRITIWEPK